MSTIDFDDIIYEDFAEAAERLATELKQKDVCQFAKSFNLLLNLINFLFCFFFSFFGQKCDYVIALTHMRLPNDMILAEESSQVDLILGGHDHDVRYENVSREYCLCLSSLAKFIIFVVGQ